MSGNGFFEMREKLTTSRKARVDAPAQNAQALSVSAVTKLIDAAIRGGVPARVAVQGEVSNFNFNRASGHAYFTLKDATACINCVMFRSDLERVKFQISDGMEMLARGGVRVYAASGRYQLYIDNLQPIGHGALELAFQQLRLKLEAEGLFRPERKKPLPLYPRRIAIITSRETAALADILKVLRQFPWIQLMLLHVPVQGENCGVQIAAAVNDLNRDIARLGGADLILLGRGGGSLEDLWGFNNESLARALAVSKIPVVTGIGHDVDVSIADLVADHHAHTPTEAARFVTLHWQNVSTLLTGAAGRFTRQIHAALQTAQQRLLSIQRHETFRRPTNRINELRMRLDDREQSMLIAMHHVLRLRSSRLHEAERRLVRNAPAVRLARFQSYMNEIHGRLIRGMTTAVTRRNERVNSLSALLEAVSPQRVLKRGYSMTLVKKTGEIVRSPSQIKPGDRLVTRLQDGDVESIADDRNQPRLFE